MRIDYNECWYQGNHDACTHTHYCIFNEHRIQLESMIAECENDLQLLEMQLLMFHEIYTTKSYDELKKEKMILIDDLEKLRVFRMNIIDNEVKEYGYEGLES